MNFRHYFKTLLSSFNPNSYKTLASRSLADSFNYFFFVLIFSIALMVVLFIPYSLSFSDNLHKNFESIETFVIDINLSTARPVIITDYPRVILDTQKENLSGELVLISKNSIQYNKYYFFGKEEVSLDELKDLKQHQKKAETIMVSILVFMVPAIAVFAFLLFAIKNLVLVFAVSFIGFIVFKLTSYHVKFFSLIKAAIYASTIMIIPEIALLLFYPAFIITTPLFIILFILASWSIAQKRFSIKRKKQQEFPEKTNP